MSDTELVELMNRWEELKQEYETFLESDLCKHIKDCEGHNPSMLEWVTELRDVPMICEECKKCYYYKACENGCFGSDKPCEYYITGSEEVEKRQRDLRF